MKFSRLLKTGFAVFLMVLMFAVSAGADTEPLTVTVYIGDPGSQPDPNNRIYSLIEERLGVKFQFEFLEGNLDESIGALIESGSYPDLMDGNNDAEILEAAKTMVNLLPYISEEETPNLYNHLYTDDRISRLVHENGELYIIPNYGIFDNEEITTEPSGPAFYIQKQVIAWNNYVVPTTLNEYFDLLERYLAANPEDANGNAYIGYEMLLYDWWNWSVLNPVQHLMGRPNDGVVIVDVDSPNYETETFINQEYAKAFYAKLNEEYNKGVIAHNTFDLDYGSYMDSLQSGTVLGMFDQGWSIGAAQQELASQGKYENTWLAIPLVYDPEYVEGRIIQEHYQNGSTMNKDRGFGISVSCEDPARMVQLFDTLLSDEWQTILQWGIEGVDYTVDDNGRMVMTEEQYNHLSSAEWRLANKADVLLNSIPKKQGTMDNGNSWDPSSQPEMYFANMSEYDKEFLAACGKTTPGEFFNSPIELAPYGEAWQLDTTEIMDTYTDFLMIQQEDLPGIITCSPEELDDKWDAFVERVSASADTVTEHIQGEITKIVGTDVPPEKCGNNLTWTLAEGQLTVSGHGNMFNYEDWEDAPWYTRRSEIQKVVIGDGVTGIGEFTFYGCSQLAQVTMADSVQRIGRRAFGYCGSLADLQLSSSLVEIDIGAFEECGALKSVTLSGSLKRIGYAAFAACGLTSIQIPAGTSTRVWDRLFDVDYPNIYLHHITLPASVTMVEYGAFWGNPLPHDTPDMVTPAELTTIEADAFNGIDARFVWLSDKVESIGDFAFANCPKLQYVFIPYGCVSIGRDAFPEGTILLGINGYSSHCYANDYADANGLPFISYENPFGGEG